MKILSAADPGSPARAAEALKIPGNVLLVPTETVYGLVCSWSDAQARANIYSMKHRAENKPLAAFVPTPEHAAKLAGIPLPPLAVKLAKKYMPGPITIIVPDSNGTTFGFRIPDHPFILALLKCFDGALASTSANLSGKPAALSVKQALDSVAEPPALAVDGGELPAGSLASTVVLVGADNSLKILRQGPLTITL